MQTFKKTGVTVINTNTAAYNRAKAIRARRRAEGTTEEKTNDMYETLVFAMERIHDLEQRIIVLESQITSTE